MGKRHYCDNTHLTLQDRMTIELGIGNNSTKVAIARTLGKDPSTIAKEIRKHRLYVRKNTFNNSNDCIHRRECGDCKTKRTCKRYKIQPCTRRDRSPGACNKCVKYNGCWFTKYKYDAKIAHEVYKETLVQSREGINTTKGELAAIADIIVPLINQGQSIYQILAAHPEIQLSERTLYNYIDQGRFKKFGINHFSMKEKIQRKRRKKLKDKYKKRNEPKIFENRRYKDYLAFKEANPDIPTVQMDTVCNEPGGPYIQTLLFESSNFMIGFIHQEKTAASMIGTFDYLEAHLGTEIFTKLFSLILTDRGSEFAKPTEFEFNSKTGKKRLNIFYCDPMRSTQKAKVENNHNYIRDIIPNNRSLQGLTNEDLQLMFSHINSTPRRCFNNKTPYDLFELIYSKTTTDLLKIKKLHPDKVVLKPFLLKLNKK